MNRDLAVALRAPKAAFEQLDRDGAIRRDLLRKAYDAPVERRDQPSRIGTSEYRDTFHNWLRSTVQGLQPDPVASALLTSEIEGRDMGLAAGAAGGFLAPQSFADTLVIALKWASPVRELGRVWLSATGADAPLPAVDDTGNLGAIQGEGGVVTSLDASWSARTLKSWMYQSQFVRASWQLLNDSAFDVEETLAELFGARIGRIQNAHFTTGTGTGQPEGFVTAGVVGVTMATGTTASFGAGAAAVTNGYGGLVNLSASVDPAYRRDPSCAWQMADSVYSQVRLLSDTAGRPLVIDAASPGGFPMLLGWPVYINNDMSGFGVSKSIVAFGAWRRHYVIRDVVGLQVSALKERFADQLQSGFIGTLRSDGRIADPRAVRLLATAAT